MASSINWETTENRETVRRLSISQALADLGYDDRLSWLAFLRALGFFESSDQYDVIGGSGNTYYGKYQFGSEGATELETIGFWSSAEATALGFTGAVDMNKFLAEPIAQELAILHSMSGIPGTSYASRYTRVRSVFDNEVRALKAANLTLDQEQTRGQAESAGKSRHEVGGASPLHGMSSDQPWPRVMRRLSVRGAAKR